MLVLCLCSAWLASSALRATDPGLFDIVLMEEQAHECGWHGAWCAGYFRVFRWIRRNYMSRDLRQNMEIRTWVRLFNLAFFSFIFTVIALINYYIV